MIDITNYFTTQATQGNFQLILIGLSFLGGLLASISPCSLAMLPIVIGYIGGLVSQAGTQFKYKGTSLLNDKDPV